MHSSGSQIPHLPCLVSSRLFVIQQKTGRYVSSRNVSISGRQLDLDRRGEVPACSEVEVLSVLVGSKHATLLSTRIKVSKVPHYGSYPDVKFI